MDMHALMMASVLSTGRLIAITKSGGLNPVSNRWTQRNEYGGGTPRRRRKRQPESRLAVLERQPHREARKASANEDEHTIDHKRPCKDGQACSGRLKPRHPGKTGAIPHGDWHQPEAQGLWSKRPVVSRDSVMPNLGGQGNTRALSFWTDAGASWRDSPLAASTQRDESVGA